MGAFECLVENCLTSRIHPDKPWWGREIKYGAAATYRPRWWEGRKTKTTKNTTKTHHPELHAEAQTDMVKTLYKTTTALGRAHSSTRLNSLRFASHRSTGSGSVPQPKCNNFVLVTHPTCPQTFVRIRPQLFEVSCSQTDKQTGVKSSPLPTFGGGGNKRK